jgi:hypothetical protein
MMKRDLCAITLIAATLGTPSVIRAADDAAPKPGWEFTREDFGVGRRHTQNDWCNQKIDALLEETRQCFNTHPAPQCEALQKRNSKKMGTYIKSSRCFAAKRKKR